jgi:membrane-associated protease RseP (regulator of RpoE activity)
MHRKGLNSLATLSALAVMIFGVGSISLAEDEDATEIRAKRVHKVMIDCDEEAGNDCEQEVRVHVIGGDHQVEVGDHPMVWVEGGEHAHHFNIATAMMGKGGFLGVQLTELTPELRAHFGVDEDEGVMVAKVIDDSAAFRAGLSAGDIITGVEGEPVHSSMDLTHAIRSREAGESVTLEIWREGAFSTLAATLDEQAMPHMAHKAMFSDCDDDEGDCDFDFDFTTMTGRDLDFDCPDSEDCQVKIECDGGDCDCSVNGESVDCPELHGLHHGN